MRDFKKFCLKRKENNNSVLKDYSQEYLTIVSLEDNNTIRFRHSKNIEEAIRTIYFSVDNGATWNEVTSSYNLDVGGGTVLTTLSKGDRMLLKGNNTNYGHSYDTTEPPFSINYVNSLYATSKFNVEGNIMSLIRDSFKTDSSLSSENNFAFMDLFKMCDKLVSAENLYIPPTTANGYVSGLFSHCTSLVNPPKLRAETLSRRAYQFMFEYCDSLVTLPELPATTLADYCYFNMFANCNGLTTVPSDLLPHTTLANGCYGSMFRSCTNLIAVPELPATTLTDYCYYKMFDSCTSLTTAPELPATTLANYCYQYMFNGCTSLTEAPALPATTLTNNCYEQMFNDCRSLTTAPELPATTLKTSCYDSMFKGCTNLNYIKCLATDISAAACTTNWVNGVAATGTFVKAVNMNDWESGQNGIPENWEVENATN